MALRTAGGATAVAVDPAPAPAAGGPPARVTGRADPGDPPAAASGTAADGLVYHTIATLGSSYASVAGTSRDGQVVLVNTDAGWYTVAAGSGHTQRVDVDFGGHPLARQVWSGAVSGDGRSVVLILGPQASGDRPDLRVVRLDGSENYQLTLPDAGRVEYVDGTSAPCNVAAGLGAVHLSDDGNVAWVIDAPCYEKRILTMDVSTTTMRWKFEDAVSDGPAKVTADGQHWLVGWDYCIDENDNGWCDASEELHANFFVVDVDYDNGDAHPNNYYLNWPPCPWSGGCGDFADQAPGSRLDTDATGSRFVLATATLGLDPDTVVYAPGKQLYWFDGEYGQKHSIGPVAATTTSSFRVSDDGRSVLSQTAYGDPGQYSMDELPGGPRHTWRDVPMSLAGGLLRTVTTTRNGGEVVQAALDGRPTRLRVAVLGDSYISGEGGYAYLPNTDVHSNDARVKNLCHRSRNSWAYTVGRRLTDYDANRLLFAACSGATTENVEHGQYNETGTHTQLNQLAAFQAAGDVDVVMLSAGGNDTHFKEIIEDCIIRRCLTAGWKSTKLQGAVHAAAKVEALLEHVTEAAPRATVFLTGYPSIVEPDQECGRLGMTGVQSSLLAGLPQYRGASLLLEAAGGLRISASEQRWLDQQLITTLNDALAKAASEAGVHYVDPHHWFSGHQVCSTYPYGHGLTPGDDIVGVLGNESFHPTAAGYDVEAARFEAHFADDFAPDSNPPAVPAGLTDPGSPNELTAVIVDGQLRAWGDQGRFSVQGAPDGTRIVVGMFSQPTQLGSAVVVDGTATVPFTVPSGLSPGLHTLVFYDGDTGEVLGTQLVPMAVPTSCGVAYGDQDVDEDVLADRCDGSLVDGPAADFDADGVRNVDDVCPYAPDPSQADADADGVGDACATTDGFAPSTDLTTFPDPPAPFAVTAHDLTAVVGTPVALPLVTIAGGRAPYTVTTTWLPRGLTLSSDGVLSGTPTGPGRSTLKVTVTDQLHQTWTGSVNVVVTPAADDDSGDDDGYGSGHGRTPLKVVAAQLPHKARVGQKYRGLLSAVGGLPAYSWTVLGRLPAGLHLRPATGQVAALKGRPRRAGTYHLRLRLADASGDAVIYRFVLKVARTG